MSSPKPIPVELAPNNLWRRKLSKDEAIMYMFSLKGWRFPNHANLVYMFEQGFPLGIWYDDAISDLDFDDDWVFNVIPVRDL